MLDRPSSEHLSKAKIQIPEARYRADLELHDRYLGFSSELLRTALAGIAAVGAIIGWFTHDGVLPKALRSTLFVGTALGALLLLALASALALTHRFLASDGMYYHLRAIKLLILREDSHYRSDDGRGVALVEEAIADEVTRNIQFKWAGYFLLGSGVLLIAGVVLLGCSFATILVG